MEDFEKKNTKEEELYYQFLKRSGCFGSDKWLEMLLADFPDHRPRGQQLYNLSKDVIISDKGKACEVVRRFQKEDDFQLTDELKIIALKRGKSEVLMALDLSASDYDKFAVKIHVDEIFNSAIKYEEFKYHKIVEKVIANWLKDKKTIHVPFEDLLDELKAPDVHYDKKMRTCPEICKQQNTCKYVKATKDYLEDILREMGKDHKIFKNNEVKVIGSIKEGSKIGSIDEVDMMITLDPKYEKDENKCFQFDDKNQNIEIEKIKKMPIEFQDFVEENGSFDNKKYFRTFIEAMDNVIYSGRVRQPRGLTFSTRLTHSCLICKCRKDIPPQTIRCKHKIGCKEHMKKIEQRDYEEQCNCRVYTNPRLTHTKIGKVILMSFFKLNFNLFLLLWHYLLIF